MIFKKYTSQWAKSPKQQSEGVRFVNSVLKMLCCKKYTPADCFFGDFAHWNINS